MMTAGEPAPCHPLPHRKSGALDNFKYIETSPALGREYPGLQLSSIIDDEEIVRDLAITASERGVLFFDHQDIAPSELKRLILKIGELMGNPKEAGLHRHAFSIKGNEELNIPEVDDPDILILSSAVQNTNFNVALPVGSRKFASWGWHSDESHEKYPPAYTGFKIAKSPPTGGDTLFVSSYGLYEYLSNPWQKFAESLTATHHAAEYLRHKDVGFKFHDNVKRGHPENVDLDFKASHPVVRTNPVTGWKGLYGVGWGLIDGSFDNMTEDESNLLKQYFLRVITDNSNLQIRKRWGDDGVAIWDNRAVHHNPTYDVVDGERTTFRVAGVGEKPYFDPNSTSRTEFLRKQRA
ncbi:Putative Taurine catabolism dioxygenase TauD, TfdA family protein [Penicillium brasilianum]|uniref:Putative Taurine catabolism dioxygenase TauD, TfdA family protein n=1 Tax=Penicillium brasilianum TaxID=104259 RepID=A0A0F7VEY3_PENBI|nr:Putative Taurine catabolism dioxygenase TauD, TfdA family protein [Penicillium brasilianum]